MGNLKSRNITHPLPVVLRRPIYPPAAPRHRLQSYPYPRKVLSHPRGPAVRAKDGRPGISLP